MPIIELILPNTPNSTDLISANLVVTGDVRVSHLAGEELSKLISIGVSGDRAVSVISLLSGDGLFDEMRIWPDNHGHIFIDDNRIEDGTIWKDVPLPNGTMTIVAVNYLTTPASEIQS